MFESEKITDHVEVRMVESKGTEFPAMIHVPTGMQLMSWAVVVGLEQAAWDAMVNFAHKAVQIQFINWETDDIDFLFPCSNFIERYMTPVAIGEKTVEEVSAELMEKIMTRESGDDDK